MKSLRKGIEALYDGLGGLIPVRILNVRGNSGIAGRQQVTAEVAESAGQYRLGEKIEQCALWFKLVGEKSNDFHVECNR